MKCPTTPTSKLVGLGYFPFARRYLGNRILLYFPQGTKMFQFPEFVLRYLMYSGRYTVPLRTVGCPIRKSSDHSLLAASLVILVSVPYFIVSYCLGILRAPLFS